MPKGVEDLDLRMGLQQFKVEDHFIGLDTTQWNTAVDGGTVAEDTTTPFGGGVRLATGATDNNEANLYTNAIFAFAPGKPVRAMGVVTITEANTNDSAWFFGLMSDMAVDTIVNGGATFRAASYGAFIWKRKDSLLLECATLNAGVLTTNATEIASTGRNTLEVLIQPYGTGNYAQVTYHIDQVGGQHPSPAFLSNRLTANQDVNFGASPTALSLACGVKAGGANSEILIVDFLGAVQRLGL